MEDAETAPGSISHQVVSPPCAPEPQYSPSCLAATLFLLLLPSAQALAQTAPFTGPCFCQQADTMNPPSHVLNPTYTQPIQAQYNCPAGGPDPNTFRFFCSVDGVQVNPTGSGFANASAGSGDLDGDALPNKTAVLDGLPIRVSDNHGRRGRGVL